MNAIQFGRWLGERRHTCGWPSQRALAAAARKHPYVGAMHISEAFLARLEAGLLSHPFRGAVRERVLALAWLLCKTPRQVRSYLAAAGLTDLTPYEAQRMEAIRSALGVPHTPPPVRLPWRSPRLVGRASEVRELMHLLMSIERGCVAVTGLAGIGKSAVAAEALHLITAQRDEGCGFPDGIVTFDCTGRIGTQGLQSLLEDVAAVFSRGDESSAARASRRPIADRDDGVARATDLARSALRGRRALLLLDGVDPRFPLTQALEALLAEDAAAPEVMWPRAAARGRAVMATTRYLPLASQLAGHLALRPLDPVASLDLLELAAGTTFGAHERDAAARLCEMAGGVPLAIVEMATAVAVARLPLGAARDPLLAVRLLDHQSGGGGMCERLSSAISLVDDTARRELYRLASRPTTHAYLRWQHGGDTGDRAESATLVPGAAEHGLVYGSHADAEEGGAWQAPAIAQLVRHSLIEPIGDVIGTTAALESRYRVNPLVRTLLLGGVVGEASNTEAAASGSNETDTVRFLRRGVARATTLSTLDDTKQRHARVR